jgi:hypothetical protein
MKLAVPRVCLGHTEQQVGKCCKLLIVKSSVTDLAPYDPVGRERDEAREGRRRTPQRSEGFAAEGREHLLRGYK